MSLAQLAAFAANNRNPAKTPLYELATAEARPLVKIKDGNRPAHEDGSQALTLVLGRYVLNLDVIAKGASRVVASGDQVAQFTGILQAAIDSGDFDGEIIIAQEKAKPKAKAPVLVTVNPDMDNRELEGTLSLNVEDVPTTDDIEGLDFGSIQ